MLTLKLWVPWRHSISSLMTPEESQLSPRLRAMSLEESWLSLRLMALSLGESRHSLGVTKDELECLQGIWDRSFIPRSPQNDSSPPYRKLENGRNFFSPASFIRDQLLVCTILPFLHLPLWSHKYVRDFPVNHTLMFPPKRKIFLYV